MSRKRRKQNNELYQPRLHVFDYKTTNNEVIKEFEQTMIRSFNSIVKRLEDNGVTISVSDLDARSIANSSGKDRQSLVQLIDTYSMQSKQRNPRWKQKHEADILHTITRKTIRAKNSKEENNLTTFRGLINRVKAYLETIEKEDYHWNRVWYGHFIERAGYYGG